MKKRLVGAIIVLALLLLFNSCASDNYIRDGYSPSGARTKEVDLVFPVTLVRGTFVFLVREFMPNGKCFIRVETLQDREWDIHSVYFFIDETRFDFVAFDKRPWTSFTKEEVAIFHASMDFFRLLNDASEIKIHIIGSKDSRLLDLDAYHYEAIHNYMNLLESMGF